MDAALALILSAPSIAVGAIWLVALVRLFRMGREVPDLAAGVPLADATPIGESVCVVVPAHNEADSIGGVVASLRAQRGVALRFVLALDRCTDGTAEQARRAIDGDDRFEIIEIDHCPEGWAGKVHALWSAVEASASARGSDLLLFLDADVTMAPDCVRAAAALRRARDLDMVTLLPTLRHRHWFERLVQPACVIELSYEFPLIRANQRQSRRAFVNGQFVLFRREAYERLGGHRALAGEIMEDFGLARLTAQHAIGVGVFPAGAMLVAGMHDSWSSFVRGWMRIFVAGAGQRVRRLEKWSMRIWGLAAGLPVLGAIALAWLLVGDGHLEGTPRAAAIGASLAGLAILHLAIGALYRRQRAPLWSVPLFVPAALIVGWIMWRAARTVATRRPIPWGGRAYVFEPR